MCLFENIFFLCNSSTSLTPWSVTNELFWLSGSLCVMKETGSHRACRSHTNPAHSGALGPQSPWPRCRVFNKLSKRLSLTLLYEILWQKSFFLSYFSLFNNNNKNIYPGLMPSQNSLLS